MSNYNGFKNVRKFCHAADTDVNDNDIISFGYCNWRVWDTSVSLVNMLVEEIQKDFHDISLDDIHIYRKDSPAYELILMFYFSSDELPKDFDFSHFEAPPTEIMKFFAD